MSVFIVPSSQAYHPFTGGHRHASQPFHGNRRCGEMTFNVQSPFDTISNYSSRRHHHPFFAQFVEEEDDDEEEEQLAQYLRARYQQQQQQQRQAAHILAARRQAEIERERERRRIQHQQIEQQQRRRRAAALARAAWQEEQVRLHRLAIAREAEEEQERNRRKRQEFAQKQWQDIASHGLAAALQFAEWFGGLEEEESQTNDNQMEVDEKSQSKSVNITTEDPIENSPEQKQVQVPIYSNDDQDPPEEDISKSTLVPIFTLPLPSNSNQRSSIKAEDIQVTFDQPTNTIQVRGLWDVNETENEEETIVLSSASSVTTNDDQEETRGRKRSRSPKRSRVSDVDETTGEEIVVEQEENTDGFVNVATEKQPQGPARIPLPQDAKLSNLRAELTDEGFKLFI